MEVETLETFESLDALEILSLLEDKQSYSEFLKYNILAQGVNFSLDVATSSSKEEKINFITKVLDVYMNEVKV